MKFSTKIADSDQLSKKVFPKKENSQKFCENRQIPRRTASSGRGAVRKRVNLAGTENYVEMLQNEPFIAKFGFDAAENEPYKAFTTSQPRWIKKATALDSVSPPAPRAASAPPPV